MAYKISVDFNRFSQNNCLWVITEIIHGPEWDIYCQGPALYYTADKLFHSTVNW